MTREEKWLKDEAAITDLIRSLGGIAKTADLYTLGIDYRRIQTFVSNGVLKKIKNGYYIDILPLQVKYILGLLLKEILIGDGIMVEVILLVDIFIIPL